MINTKVIAIEKKDPILELKKVQLAFAVEPEVTTRKELERAYRNALLSDLPEGMHPRCVDWRLDEATGTKLDILIFSDEGYDSVRESWSTVVYPDDSLMYGFRSVKYVFDKMFIVDDPVLFKYIEAKRDILRDVRIIDLVNASITLKDHSRALAYLPEFEYFYVGHENQNGRNKVEKETFRKILHRSPWTPRIQRASWSEVYPYYRPRWRDPSRVTSSSDPRWYDRD